MKKNKAVPSIVSLLLIFWLLLPMLATVLYAFSGQWDHSILPEELTLKWFASLFSDPRFIAAMGRTMLLCGSATALGVLFTVPTIFYIVMWHPKWERFLSILTVLPYGLPGVVAVVGLLQVYSSGPLAIAGTPWIVLGAYMISVLPYLYQSSRNALHGINARQLVESACLLGASPWRSFLHVIIPGITGGIVSGAILSFSVLFGEFVLANLLIGRGFETIQMYLYRRLLESGHTASAVVVVYLIIIALVSYLLVVFSQSGKTHNRREK